MSKTHDTRVPDGGIVARHFMLWAKSHEILNQNPSDRVEHEKESRVEYIAGMHRSSRFSEIQYSNRKRYVMVSIKYLNIC